MVKRLLLKPEDLGSDPDTYMKSLNSWLIYDPNIKPCHVGDQVVAATWFPLCSLCGVVL